MLSGNLENNFFNIHHTDLKIHLFNIIFLKFVVTIKYNYMFGDMMQMMGKLKETQQKVEATKKRLDTVLIDEKSSDGLLQITLNANRTILKIEIADDLMKDNEQLEDYLITTLNKAIQKATQINEYELAAVAKEGMPNIPGMDLFK